MDWMSLLTSPFSPTEAEAKVIPQDEYASQALAGNVENDPFRAQLYSIIKQKADQEADIPLRTRDLPGLRGLNEPGVAVNLSTLLPQKGYAPNSPQTQGALAHELLHFIFNAYTPQETPAESAKLKDLGTRTPRNLEYADFVLNTALQHDMIKSLLGEGFTSAYQKNPTSVPPEIVRYLTRRLFQNTPLQYGVIGTPDR